MRYLIPFEGGKPGLRESDEVSDYLGGWKTGFEGIR
jgi:hypothetical protein